jgi:hypothetical protein
MSGMLYFKTRRDMDLMAAVLIGKGKKVTPVEPSTRYRNDDKWRINVEPPVRWSSQRNYERQIEAFEKAVVEAHGINVHPRDLAEDKISNMQDQYWLCLCIKVRPIAADRCFRCHQTYPSNFQGVPDTDTLRAYLVERYKEKASADG